MSTKCFDCHKFKSERMKRSLCDKYVKCLTCHKVLDIVKRSRFLHTCGEMMCKFCHIYYTGQHFCHMQSPKNMQKPVLKHIYFDSECEQTTGEHKPNLVVACSVCDKCEKIG